MTDEGAPAAAGPFSGQTAWARSLQTPLRVFLRIETGGAAVLLGAAVAALAWVNVSSSSYNAVWGARLSVRLAGAGVSLGLREWVNSGLMTFFFFVFGLEGRREFDMGELRERARLALPVAAGLGCECRQSHPHHATRRYSLIMPPMRVFFARGSGRE